MLIWIMYYHMDILYEDKVELWCYPFIMLQVCIGQAMCMLTGYLNISGAGLNYSGVRR